MALLIGYFQFGGIFYKFSIIYVITFYYKLISKVLYRSDRISSNKY